MRGTLALLRISEMAVLLAKVDGRICCYETGLPTVKGQCG